MTPATTAWYDPALTVGQSFTDTDAGVTITTLSADANGALVDISIASQPCTRANPTLTLGPSQTPWLQAGATANFSVTLKNNDGNGCQSALFNWQSTIPAGWSASALPSTVLSPGATASTTFAVTSPAAAVDGFYSVRVTAANGSNSTSAAATYSLVSALSIVSTATQTTYTRNQTVTVNTTVRAVGSVVSGATVTFTMTKSNGTTVSITSTTSANGIAVFKYSLNKKKDSAGTYQVRAQANSNGISGSSTVSFVVK
jgi:hypothetical protein